MRLPRSWPRPTWTAVALAVALSGGACAADAPDGYSADTRAAMMTACAEDDADRDLADVCACVYDTAEESLDFEEFAAMERRLREGETELPNDLAVIVRDCIREVSATRR